MSLSNVIVGVVRVNVALAVFPAASVIVTVFVANAVIGTLNVAAVIPPVEFESVALSVTAAPLTFAVSALFDANPVAVTVMVAPLTSVVGVIVIDGVTVIACWIDRPVFKSETVSKYVPAKRLVGTMNHVVFVKSLFILMSPNWLDWTTLPVTKAMLLNVASVILLKPVMLMLTLLPDAAVAGANSVGRPNTWIDASAVSVEVALTLNV